MALGVEATPRSSHSGKSAEPPPAAPSFAGRPAGCRADASARSTDRPCPPFDDFHMESSRRRGLGRRRSHVATTSLRGARLSQDHPRTQRRRSRRSPPPCRYCRRPTRRPVLGRVSRAATWRGSAAPAVVAPPVVLPTSPRSRGRVVFIGDSPPERAGPRRDAEEDDHLSSVSDPHGAAASRRSRAPVPTAAGRRPPAAPPRPLPGAAPNA